VKGQYGNPSRTSLQLFCAACGGAAFLVHATTLHDYPNLPRPNILSSIPTARALFLVGALAKRVAQDARDYFDGRDVAA